MSEQSPTSFWLLKDESTGEIVADGVGIGNGVAYSPVEHRNKVMRCWVYKGRKYLKGVGKLYTQEGFPIAMSLDMAYEYEADPCMNNIVAELIENGMAMAKAQRMVREAVADMVGPMPDWWRVPDWVK